MIKRIIVFAGLMSMMGFSFAQKSLFQQTESSDHSLIDSKESYERSFYAMKASYSSFSRGSGFTIRPELYRGIFASLGYQINPYVQTFVGIGYGDGITGALGARAYTGDADWVAMFDLRFELTNFYLPGISLVAGASYKDLDFGAGIRAYTDGYYYLIVPVLCIGWNIRCYDHR